MKFVFMSTNRRLQCVFRDLVCSEIDSMEFYEDTIELMTCLLEKKSVPDLLVIDGSRFGGHKNFVYKMLGSSGLHIPAIFINNPDEKESLEEESDSDRREIEWLFENEFNFEKTNLHRFLPVFQMIDSITKVSAFKNAALQASSPELSDRNNQAEPIPLRKDHTSSYRIPLAAEKDFFRSSAFQPAHQSPLQSALQTTVHSTLQPALQKSKNDQPLFQAEGAETSGLKIQLQKNQVLTPVLQQLYNHFYLNRNRPLSISEIAMHLNLNDDDDDMMRNSAYAYVARLRKSMKAIKSQFQIERVCKGQYRLMEVNLIY